MSNAQIFGQISDQNALFLMERRAVGRIIFVVFLLVNSLEFERTRKWFVIDIMHLKMSNGAFRLDAKQREAKVGELRQPSRVVDYVTREGCQPSRVVANLRDWSLHRLILTTYF